jgi:hypothetical protein
MTHQLQTLCWSHPKYNPNTIVNIDKLECPKSLECPEKVIFVSEVAKTRLTYKRTFYYTLSQKCIHSARRLLQKWHYHLMNHLIFKLPSLTNLLQSELHSTSDT